MKDQVSKENIPINGITILNNISEPPSIINNMDVDRVMSMISAAQAGNTRDYFALCRDIIYGDSHIQTELGKRKLAVLGDSLNVRPYDPNDANDVETAKRVQECIESFPQWRIANSNILDSTLWPVSVTEKVFRIENQFYNLDQLIRVPPQLFDYSTGRLMIYDVDSTGNILSTVHEPDPDRYIIHRGHLLSSPDNWGGPIRSLLFWCLLGTMTREWWARFLDRYGTPFLVGTYDSNQEGSRDILERAFALSVKLGGLVVSEGTKVEIKQASATDSGDAYEKFHSICNREKSKLILGQTLSTEADPTGLGGGASQIQEGVRQDIRRFDSMMLVETLRNQFVKQFCKINRLPGRLPKLIWGSESKEEMQARISLIKALKESGYQISDESLQSLSEQFGLSIERDTSPSFPTLSAMSASANRLHGSVKNRLEQMDAISGEGSAGLAQAFRGSLAPIQNIIKQSRSAKECESRIKAFLKTYRPGEANQIITEALEAYSANGSIQNRQE